jgi:membrane protein GlpM
MIPAAKASTSCNKTWVITQFFVKCIRSRLSGEGTMWALVFKCTLGALVVLLISILSKSKAFYIAGLVPLFPTFALIAHVIVFQQQGADALRRTALFGLWSLIPYAIYLIAVYLLATQMSVLSCLSLATLAWTIAAGILLYGWYLWA